MEKSFQGSFHFLIVETVNRFFFLRLEPCLTNYAFMLVTEIKKYKILISLCVCAKAVCASKVNNALK